MYDSFGGTLALIDLPAGTLRGYRSIDGHNMDPAKWQHSDSAGEGTGGTGGGMGALTPAAPPKRAAHFQIFRAIVANHSPAQASYLMSKPLPERGAIKVRKAR
jgi:hypothetical protein